MQIKTDWLGKAYRANDYLSLLVTPAGKEVFSLLKDYFIGLIFRSFPRPILIDTPLVQKSLEPQKGQIGLGENACLRHTFHHFYFDFLKQNRPESLFFPLEFIEQGLLFRKEKKEKLKFLSRQSTLTVTDLHIFCSNLDQARNEIRRVIKTIKRMEKDFGWNYHLDCSMRKEGRTLYSLFKNEWRAEFQIRKDLEEAEVAVDFSIILEDNKEKIELSGLELSKVRLGNKRLYLVDFTVGSLERTIGALLELFSGKLPLWLAPIQVVVVGKASGFSILKKKANLRVLQLRSQGELAEISQKIYLPLVITKKTPRREVALLADKIENTTPPWLKNSNCELLSFQSAKRFILDISS